MALLSRLGLGATALALLLGATAEAHGQVRARAAIAAQAQSVPAGVSRPGERETAGDMEQERVLRAQEEFGVGLTPGVAIATKDARFGFNLGIEGTYGVAFGPLIVAPGAAAQLVAPKGTTILSGFPIFKVLVPLGDFAPYGVVGVGLGADTQTSDAGLALRGGVGVRYSITETVGLVLEGAYLDVAGVPIANVALGPVITM